MRWLDSITNAMNMNLVFPSQTPGYGERQEGLWSCSMGSQRVRHNWATEQQQEITISFCLTILNLRHQFSLAFELRLKYH